LAQEKSSFVSVEHTSTQATMSAVVATTHYSRWQQAQCSLALVAVVVL
jgi:hypothetical protein